ncbi:glycosyl hydrolase family 8 [Oceaniglobus trochenteri]|uniref:glycosyl hydrolase family 8 n=1 Tax=Oceaniglobus trochenteri TaxID=2763260 RepID=UPI001CFF6AEE|nr:glycosyl hydrolase family 8 [Oceaniglobus trochenteri]
MMKRREFLTGLGTCAGMAALPGLPALAQEADLEINLQDVWAAWQKAHLDSSGRVIDRIQQNASHSEGQAYGMFLAATVGDRRTFDRIETWTKVNLAIRPDNLLAWRWLPDAPERVPDTNNASDGDLFRAWALLKASRKFSVPEYRDLAQRIATDLVDSCIVEIPGAGGMPLMLPAAHGFHTETGFIVNPCYSMPLAMTELATAFDLPDLARAARGAVDLQSKLARGGVVPDWVAVNGGDISAAPDFSFNAGYEAMRIPLFLIWSGLKAHPAVLRYAEAQARAPEGSAATVIDRQSGEIIETSGQAGYKAVAALSICTAQNHVGSALPPFVPEDPYYPATLQVMAMIAQAQSAPMCFPL